MRSTIAALLAALFIITAITRPSFACGPEVQIQFSERSPDQFRIVFVRGPKLSLQTLTITLDGSTAGVIFDNYNGLGLQGPQPSPSGAIIRSLTYASGRAQQATLTFDQFTESRWFDFASDLDDRGLGADLDQNHIYDGELTGATARAVLVGTDGRPIEIDGQFDDKGYARLGSRACV